MPYVILVPGSAKENYEIALKKGYWGGPENRRKLNELKMGDKLIFVHSVKYGGDGKAPRGFPRLKTYDGVGVKLEEYRLAEVVAKPTRDTSVFGERYPVVFKVRFGDETTDVDIHDLDDEIVEAIRVLTTGKGMEEISKAAYDTLF